MAKDVNLTSQEWCDIVFEGKNKKYGAYYLRKTSSKRHRNALLILLGIMAGLVFLPSLIEKVLPAKQVETITDVVKMTNLNQLEEPKPENQVQQIEAPPPPALKEAIKFTPPVIDKNATDQDNMRTQEEVTKSKAVIFSENVEGSDDPNAVDPGTLVVVKAVTAAVVKKEIIDFAEVSPTFPGGDKARIDFLNKNLKYPAIAAENGIEGRVTLRFAVMDDGRIDKITILKSVHPSLDQEAIRVVKSMPKWIPGKQNGKNVSVFFNLPIVFKLEQQ